MVDSYPLYLDLGQIHCISLYPPEPSASRRCKVQRTKDKGQYTLTQSPLQRGRVPHPGRDTRPPREGKTVAVQPATTCTEPRHASGSGCPPLAREGKTIAVQPATTCTEPRHASGSGCAPYLKSTSSEEPSLSVSLSHCSRSGAQPVSCIFCSICSAGVAGMLHAGQLSRSRRRSS